MSYSIEILDEKSLQVLHRLVQKKMILMHENQHQSWQGLVDALRQQAKECLPDVDIIREEVEKVRAERYARKTASADR